MSPGERDTDPTPDTDKGWTTTTPPPMPRRAKRESVATVAGKAIAQVIKRAAPYAGALVIALLTLWTRCIDERADRARDKAAAAEKRGAATKVEAQAGYDATKEKVDATGDVTAELATELKALREELERLKADKAGRKPKPKPAAVKIPPVVTTPLPDTPAAAAAQAADAGPTPEPKR